LQNQVAESFKHILVLFEVGAEHPLHKLVPKDLLSQMLNLVDLLWLHFFVHPLRLSIIYASFLFVAGIYDQRLILSGSVFILGQNTLRKSTSRSHRSVRIGCGNGESISLW
jgi:hypothetical protein